MNQLVEDFTIGIDGSEKSLRDSVLPSMVDASEVFWRSHERTENRRERLMGGSASERVRTTTWWIVDVFTSVKKRRSGTATGRHGSKRTTEETTKW